MATKKQLAARAKFTKMVKERAKKAKSAKKTTKKSPKKKAKKSPKKNKKLNTSPLATNLRLKGVRLPSGYKMVKIKRKARKRIKKSK